MNVAADPGTARHAPAFVANATGGAWVRTPARGCAAVRTDTRDIQPGDAFCALPGAHADGHAFIANAAERGASFAIITEQAAAPTSLPDGFGLLRVGDGRRALRAWAAAHRARLVRPRVVSVSGSAGKTTSVRLVHAALSPLGRGTHAPRSFNNELGVTMTIVAADPNDDYLVCEVGTSLPGETADLADLVRPHVALITSLGREHMEHFGTLEGVAQETIAITEYVEQGGMVVAPSDEPLLVSSRPTRTFGAGARADVRVERIEQSWAGLEATIAGITCTIPLIGAHNARNAAGAVAVAVSLGVEPAAAASALAGTRPPPMRLERIEHGGVRVLHDAYNAHPDSLAAALDTLGAIEPGSGARRVAILGPMLELGDLTGDAHAEAGARARDACDVLITLGSPAARAAETFGNGAIALGQADGDRPGDPACAEAAAQVASGDLVLIKASRGAGLERVVAHLAARAQG